LVVLTRALDKGVQKGLPAVAAVAEARADHFHLVDVVPGLNHGRGTLVGRGYAGEEDEKRWRRGRVL